MSLARSLPSRTSDEADRRERRDGWVVAGAALAYLPFVFLGYGADPDAYLVVEAGERLVDGLAYAPSRQPGFLVHEAATGLLDRIGGAVATNLGTLAVALLALASFLALCRRLRVPHRTLLGLAFALHPFVWANAATTIDYLWALGFGLAGGVALLDRRWVGAGLLFALAVGARLTSGVFVAGLFGYVLWRDWPAWRGVVGAGVLAAGLGALCYLPTILYYGGTLDFLQPVGAEEQATWSWIEWVGRFGYKNVYFWGLPAALLFVGGAVRAVIRRPSVARHGPTLVFAAAVVLGYELLYLRYPLEQEYLIPMLPFVLIGLGVLAERRWLVAVVVLVLAYNVVSVNLARPDRPNHASSIEVGVWIEPGYLVTDVAQRLRVRGCRTLDCWSARSENGRFPALWGTESR